MSKKRIALLVGCMLGCSILSGCGNTANVQKEEEPVTVGTYEAEDGVLAGNARVGNSIGGFSGNGYVEGFEADGDTCTFTITIEEAGFYDLQFTAAAIGVYG